MDRIYLDNAATTPLDKEVIAEIAVDVHGRLLEKALAPRARSRRLAALIERDHLPVRNHRASEPA